MIFRGLLPAILATLLASAGLYLATENPALLITSLLETFLVYYLIKKGVLILIADFVFWLVIGLPITYLIIKYFYQVTSSDFSQVILIKQALNGSLNVSLALLLQPFLPTNWYSSETLTRLPKLANRIFELTLICIAFPALLVTLILSDSNADNSEQETGEVLSIRAEHLSALISRHLLYHQKAVENLSEVISANVMQKDDPLGILWHWNNNYPGFITMLITDEKGLVVSGVPMAMFDKLLALPESSRMVTDRDYFTEAKKTNNSYISEVFLGRGFGNDPIIAISAPYYESGVFKGVVEGSLHLPNFNDIDLSGDNHSVVVIDSSNKVIYSSAILGIEPLSSFDTEDEALPYSNSLPAIQINEVHYLYKKIATDNDWTVMVLSKPNTLITAYKNNFYKLIISLLAISFLALAVTRRFAKQITGPLERLVKYFEGHEAIQKRSMRYLSSKEIESIREQLIDAQALMIGYQDNLREEVNEKTKELKLINKKLELLSSQDQLTNIFNRRGFEQTTESVYQLSVRNRTPLTFAIADVDFFKRINDRWGHSAGDHCLVLIAEKLREVFKRETDFVGRFGGEEFVVMIAEGMEDTHLALLEQLRVAIEEMSLMYEGHRISMTVSIGAYTIKECFDLSYEELIKKSDMLLYASKKSGRNRITHGNQ